MEQTVMRTSGDYQILENYFQEIRIKHLFLVCGRSILNQRINAFFENLEGRIKVTRFSDFTANPQYTEAMNAAEAFRKAGCDAIAAVGGGSAIDIAKCVKLWAGAGKKKDARRRAPGLDKLPLLAVPTTAGTGSEATRYAVVYDQGEKQSVAHKDCIPSAVLLDPSTLETLPDYHRKASMLDAFCHGLESFWSVHSTLESREISRKAISGILEALPQYLKNAPEGNAGMLEAAYLAGTAIDRTQTTAGHAMCYKMTSLYGIAHGHAAALCVSRLWPYMAERAGTTPLQSVLQEIAAAMGCQSIPESICKFEDLLKRLDLKTPRPKAEDFLILRNSVNPVRMKNNPIIPSLEDIYTLYCRILSEGGPAQ